MSLWDLLHLVCVAMTIGGALAPARLAHAGFGGYSLVIFLSLALGLFCAWTMHVVGRFAFAHIRRKPEALWERHFRLVYFGAMFWVLCTGLLGALLSSLIMAALS